MLDQTFSVENFRRIYDSQNRRGANVDKQFFPDVVLKNSAITARSASVRLARKIHKLDPTDANKASLDGFRADLARLRVERDDLIDDAIEAVAFDVPNYRIDLISTIGPNNMPLYVMPNDACAYFIGKQLQHNISALYQLRAGNRRAIVSQVSDALGNSFNQSVVRTDISQFYESIDRSLLLRDLEQDQILSWASKRHIKQCLASFGQQSQSPKGLPRGLGVSAYLSELYMRSVDREIMKIPDLTYYARYVDDIIAIFSPTSLTNTTTYLAKITAAAARKTLTLNPAKTIAGATGGNQAFNFDYLGYKFSVAGGNCQVTLTSRKIQRYRERIDAAFIDYERTSNDDQKGAARLLVSRIKFLTSNTRLYNNKSHAFTGIYFSNSHLNNLTQFTGLDHALRRRIQSLSSAALQNRLVGFSFLLGFQERRYVRFSTIELGKIVKAWRYEN